MFTAFTNMGPVISTPGMAEKMFLQVCWTAQDCSGGSGELSRAVTDNGLGEPEAASAWLLPVLAVPALRHWDALVSYVDNREQNKRCESEKQLPHYK